MKFKHFLQEMYQQILSATWRPFCLGLKVFMWQVIILYQTKSMASLIESMKTTFMHIFPSPHVTKPSLLVIGHVPRVDLCILSRWISIMRLISTMTWVTNDSLYMSKKATTNEFIILAWRRHGLLARYLKLWVVYAPGMPGTFSPPPWVSNPDMHHGTCVTHVPWCMPGSLTSGFPWIRWQGKRSWHSRRMRKPPLFNVRGPRHGNNYGITDPLFQ